MGQLNKFEELKMLNDRGLNSNKKNVNITTYY